MSRPAPPTCNIRNWLANSASLKRRGVPVLPGKSSSFGKDMWASTSCSASPMMVARFGTLGRIWWATARHGVLAASAVSCAKAVAMKAETTLRPLLPAWARAFRWKWTRHLCQVAPRTFETAALMPSWASLITNLTPRRPRPSRRRPPAPSAARPQASTAWVDHLAQQIGIGGILHEVAEVHHAVVIGGPLGPGLA